VKRLAKTTQSNPMALATVDHHMVAENAHAGMSSSYHRSLSGVSRSEPDVGRAALYSSIGRMTARAAELTGDGDGRSDEIECALREALALTLVLRQIEHLEPEPQS